MTLIDERGWKALGPTEILEQIRERRRLIREVLIGTLYPSILAGQIERLETLYDEVRFSKQPRR